MLEILIVAMLSVEPGRVCAPLPLMRHWLERAGFEPDATVAAAGVGRQIVLYRDRAPPHEVWLISAAPGPEGRWCVLARGGRPT